MLNTFTIQTFRAKYWKTSRKNSLFSRIDFLIWSAVICVKSTMVFSMVYYEKFTERITQNFIWDSPYRPIATTPLNIFRQ